MSRWNEIQKCKHSSLFFLADFSKLIVVQEKVKTGYFYSNENYGIVLCLIEHITFKNSFFFHSNYSNCRCGLVMFIVGCCCHNYSCCFFRHMCEKITRAPLIVIWKESVVDSESILKQSVVGSEQEFRVCSSYRGVLWYESNPSLVMDLVHSIKEYTSTSYKYTSSYRGGNECSHCSWWTALIQFEYQYVVCMLLRNEFLMCIFTS